MANHVKRFKKKIKLWTKKVENSLSYQRYRDQVRNSTSPGSVTSPTGNHVSSESYRRSAPETTVSREPPAPRFLVEAHALWQAYASVRETNPLSDRVALYRAAWLNAKYALHVPDPPLDYCFALEEKRFLETLRTIENQQESGQPISNEKRQQLLQIWENDLLPIKENKNDNPTQSFHAKELSFTNISRDKKTGPAVSRNIRKHDRALNNRKIKLQDVKTKLIQVLSAKQKAIDPLKRVKATRNMHREKTVAAEEKLKEVKK